MAIPEVPIAAANQVYLKATSTAPVTGRTTYGTDKEVATESWVPGPTVNGAETKMYIFKEDQLLNSPIWERFLTTVNLAYAATHKVHHILGSKPRVAQPSEYLSAIGGGADDNAFTLVCSAGDSDQVLATASAHEWTAPDPADGDIHLMARAHAPVSEAACSRTIFWEIKLLAVHPDFQRRGLAGSMLRYAEKEIATAHSSSKQDKNLTVVLSAIREINYDVYVNKGYSVDYEEHRPAGTLKSERPFTLTHLSKRISIDR